MKGSTAIFLLGVLTLVYAQDEVQMTTTPDPANSVTENTPSFDPDGMGGTPPAGFNPDNPPPHGHFPHGPPHGPPHRGPPCGRHHGPPGRHGFHHQKHPSKELDSSSSIEGDYGTH